MPKILSVNIEVPTDTSIDELRRKIEMACPYVHVISEGTAHLRVEYYSAVVHSFGGTASHNRSVVEQQLLAAGAVIIA